MLTFQNSHLFTFVPPKTLEKPCKSRKPKPKCFPQTAILRLSGKQFTGNCLSSDEFPVDESFESLLEAYGPKTLESEDEARRSNWIERGWAPWEEILTPEGKFARTSLNEGMEIPLETPEAIEAFKMMSPKYRKKNREEMGLTEEEFFAKQFEIQGEIPKPLKTVPLPLMLRHVPPRDWPPRGWEVDKKELEFIREAHKLQAEGVDFEKPEDESTNTDDLCLDRYKVFLKQYNEWVSANKDRLEEESYKFDQDYYPGRRKRGKDYKEGMYELPFYYPGQICAGQVTTLHLYQGAFVDIGGVYDGWVPIKRNDWFWVRHHIKVGMNVTVEILAKRDPYRFRFPIEMRFVVPNIDRLIFNRFDFPPIFHREEDSPDETRRDCGRPPIPIKDPEIKVEEEPLLSNHPYVDKLWQIHNAEQMILDDMEANPDKYKDKKWTELADDDDYDEQNSIEYTKVHYQKNLIPKMIVKISVKELDLEAALAERQLHSKLRKEAKERGEEYKITRLRRNEEMDECDFLHWRRSFEEREALIRDISCRRALGLPLREPGRFKDADYFREDGYDPENPIDRADYWGEPKNSEKSRQLKISHSLNEVLKCKDDTVWREYDYEEEARKQWMLREAQSKGEIQKEADEQEFEGGEQEEDEDEDDFIMNLILNPPSTSIVISDEPGGNGTEIEPVSV